MTEKVKVLIVDDESGARKLINEFLKDEYEVYSADSVTNAVETYQSNRPEIVISDIKMPEKDGFSLLNQLKDIDPELIFIFITGHAEKELAINAVKGGVFDFLEKPFDQEDLMIALERATKHINLKNQLVESRIRSIESERLAALGLMAGSVAHEIMQPIQLLFGAAARLENLSKKEKIENSEILNYAEKINRVADRMIKTVKSLKNLSHIGGDENEEVAVNDIFEDIVYITQDQFVGHKIEFDRSFVSEALTVECKRVEISQVLINLINNAVHAIEHIEEKRISLEAEDQGDYVEISVTDSGSGIPKEVAVKLFQPFFTTKPVGKGTGLGLFVSRQLIENHHGTLEIDHQCQNTKFKVILPKVQPNESAEPIAKIG